MSDTLTPEHRSRVMSNIRSQHTKPEWILRSALHRLGFRFSLKNNKLPGKPDLVLKKYGTAIFVHGCFWHSHPGCSKATVPKSNSDFWREKLERNVQKDKENISNLEKAGWKVIVVWECGLKRDTLETIQAVSKALLGGTIPRENIAKLVNDRLNRSDLLKNADLKVKKRLSSYNSN